MRPTAASRILRASRRGDRVRQSPPGATPTAQIDGVAETTAGTSAETVAPPPPGGTNSCAPPPTMRPPASLQIAVTASGTPDGAVAPRVSGTVTSPDPGPPWHRGQANAGDPGVAGGDGPEPE